MSGAAAATPVLDIENLTVRLRSAHDRPPIVDDLSLQVLPAESVAIVGQSGAGKSLSIRAMLGLLDPRRFDVTGALHLGGTDVAQLSARHCRQHVSRWASLVFQNPTRALNPTMRVGLQISEALTKGGRAEQRLDKKAAREKSVALMRDVGIADPGSRFHAFPHQLSGGMRQRIVIAIALACNPQIIFCDEPTSSLDVTTQAVVMDLLDDLRTNRGIAIVLVTHDLALASSRVDRVAVMHRGRVVEMLGSSSFAARAAMPYTRDLIRAVPNADDALLPESITVLPDRPDIHTGCSYQAYCTRALPRCTSEVPALDRLAEGHWARCWSPVPVGAESSSAAAR